MCVNMHFQMHTQVCIFANAHTHISIQIYALFYNLQVDEERFLMFNNKDALY